jgi:hypothetical protein
MASVIRNVATTDPDYFTNLDEIIRVDDRIETDVVIPAWGGKAIRIRALSFQDMEWINRESTQEDGKLNHLSWVFNTIHKGVIRPLINAHQAKQLGEKNGAALNELAENIWEISRVSKKVFDEYIQKLQELSEEEEKDEKEEEKRRERRTRK